MDKALTAQNTNLQQLSMRKSSEGRLNLKKQLPINHIHEIKKQKMFDRQFKQLIKKQKQHRLRRAFYSVFPRSIKTQLVKNNKIKQQWEEKETQLQEFLAFLQQYKSVYFIVNMIVLMMRVIVAWYTSMTQVFNFSGYQYMYIIIIPLVIFEIFLQAKGQSKAPFQKKNNNIGNMQVYSGKLYIIIFCILKQFSFMDSSFAFILFDGLYVYLEYQRCAEIYQTLRRIVISSFQVSRQIKLMEMVITILVVGHFFSICLYAMTFLDNQQNWTNKVDQILETWLDKYAYSLYFTYSTMLTVGYGDLTPTNKYQIAGILFTQIFGVVIFAFIVNEIGSTLSDMRKQSEVIEEDISMIERISKYYDLSPYLAYRARSFILCNENGSIDQKLGNQNALMNKLNDNLKQAITKQTNSKLINKSLFFLCFWTKNFRNQLANHIVKTILPPNQKIIQIPRRQTIYIIQKGVLSITLQRKSSQNKVFLRKKIKTLNIDPKNQILDNTIGYICALTHRPINIVATAEKFVVAYTIDAESFIKIIKDDMHNYQYLMELKTKVSQKRIVQSFQIPEIENPAEHFYPNRYVLVNRNRRVQQVQNRQRYSRRIPKRKLFFEAPLEGQPSVSYLCQAITNKDKQKENSIKLSEQFQITRNFGNFFCKYNLSNVIDQLRCKNYTLNLRGNFRC